MDEQGGCAVPAGPIGLTTIATAGTEACDGERWGVDVHTGKLLLQRPHRRHLWRAALGGLLFSTLLEGGVHVYPHHWIAAVLNACLFLAAVWLIFSAGLRFGQSTGQAQSQGAEARQAMDQR